MFLTLFHIEHQSCVQLQPVGKSLSYLRKIGFFLVPQFFFTTKSAAFCNDQILQLIHEKGSHSKLFIYTVYIYIFYLFKKRFSDVDVGFLDFTGDHTSILRHGQRHAEGVVTCVHSCKINTVSTQAAQKYISQVGPCCNVFNRVFNLWLPSHVWHFSVFPLVPRVIACFI